MAKLISTPLVTGDGEVIYRTYDYCQVDGAKHSLVVTNRRIISRIESVEKNEISRTQKEILLGDVSSVSSSYQYKYKGGWLAFLLLGVLALAVFILSATTDLGLEVITALPFVAVGVLFVFIAVFLFKNRKTTTMSLTLFTSKNYQECLSVACSSNKRRARKNLADSTNSVSVEISEKIADKMISEIGKFIIDNK
jgi:hypothetical protein